VLIYEYTLDGTPAQEAATREAMRVVQFVRNTGLRLWMDRRGTSKHDLQGLCAALAKEFPFVRRLARLVGHRALLREL
jgi:putative transposase